MDELYLPDPIKVTTRKVSKDLLNQKDSFFWVPIIKFSAYKLNI